MTQTQSQIKAKNKRFWAKTKAQKRVAVAKDVIAQLEANFYIGKQSTYFKPILKEPRDLAQYENLDTLLTDMQHNKEACHVCGIGACFASLVNLGDSFKTNKVFTQDRFRLKSFTPIDETKGMRTLLRKVFTSNQMSLIECAFEQETRFTDQGKADCAWETRALASKFGEYFYFDSERLLAIMKNIVKNKGTFKP